VKVLFDACIPRPLRTHLSEFEVVTARERGWEQLSNGRLLTVAQVDFDVLLTVDRGMRYQQPTHRFDIGVVTVRVRGNHVRYFLPVLDEIRKAIQESKPGGGMVVDGRGL